MTVLSALLPAIGPYTLMYLLAVLAGVLLAWRQATRHGLPPLTWLPLVATAVAAGVAGSRLLHFDPAAAAGARTVLGGVLAGALALLLGIRFLRLDPRAPDSLAPVLPLSLALGRVGCLLAGCCYGEPVHLPWAVLYDVHSPAYAAQLDAGLITGAAAQSLPVHPTQLYEILVALAALALLPSFRRALRAPGSLFLATLATLGSGRLAVEFLRPRSLEPVLGLDRVQWLIAALVLVALLALVVRERSQRQRSHGAGAAAVRGGWRVGVVLVGPPTLLLLGGGRFAAVEAAALALLSVPALLAVLRYAGGLARTRRTVAPAGNLVGRRLAPVTAFALILPLSLQEVVLPRGDSAGRATEAGYPRRYTTLGVSGVTSESQDQESIYRGEGECGAMYDFYPVELRHRLVGLTAAHTTERSASQALAVRLRGFLGRVEATPRAEEALPVEENSLGGLGLDVRYDRYWVGGTAGVAFGRFQASGDEVDAAGIAALRVGPLSSLHAFAAINDLDPLGTPREDGRFGLGMRLAENGSTLRAGVWRGGDLFVHATLVAGDWEIEPFAGLAEKSEWRLAVRRRFGQRSAAPDLGGR